MIPLASYRTHAAAQRVGIMLEHLSPDERLQALLGVMLATISTTPPEHWDVTYEAMHEALRLGRRRAWEFRPTMGRG